MFKHRLSLTALAIALLPTAALANDEQGDDPHGKAHADDDGIVVVGHPPVDFNLLNSTSTIEGDKLDVSLRGQLGETLASLPGVSATSFTPGASRPVLRGFDGDRIRVLTDGIGAIDASSVSADHAVVFDALTVDHIDVLHGPAVLLFGGQAIGGAVNALDKRIPRAVPDGIKLDVLGSYGSAASERAASGAAQFRLGDRWAASVDASWRKSDDLKVPGFVNSPSLRAALLDEAAEYRADGEPAEAEEYEELANLSGKVPNTAARSTTFGAGLAFIDAGGNLGISVQRQDMRYGLPSRPGAGHHDHGGGDHGEEPVSIELGQTRVDLRGAVELGDGLFDSIQVRSAFGDYQHIEFEGDEVGTTFTGRGVEARADLVQNTKGGWRGRSGIQYFTRNLSIVGAEAFAPSNDVTRFGVFTLQSLRIGQIELEGAGRYERATVRANSVGFQQAYDLWSGSAGLTWRFAPGWKLGASYIRGARAPAPEELLSDGLHVATQSYELGNAAFRPETSNGGEVFLRYDGGRYNLSLTGYLSDFDSFIAALPNGAEIDGFPVFEYSQGKARFQGFEAAASAKVLDWTDGGLTLDAQADYTHAELKGVGPVPRIPPLRLRGGAEFEFGPLHLRSEVEWNDKQDRVASFETPVAGFTLVNVSAVWHPLGDEGPLTLSLAANNLFNVSARRAASFTRDFVPLAGRDVRVTAKLSF
ncbi:TonB-dependent receptor [Novosphingobium ginsenosidimutans]|uniref:TonB-dependent receptor n=1 Tax=Novosphingobium ginsenosidimutans TaxID=1176536 RepID=A0A5B8S698_9SPHN|nr:TonB-dependent receptor [Novosphingobium ginsenosidimutans]QEA17119.1 TonB-dependent receptor [Novosphingobium ginsenosidimutans]